MKKRFIFTFDKFIAALLAIVGCGAVSCSEGGGGFAPMYGVPTVEYGVPHAEYKIKGTVTADTETKNPIKGIRVTVKDNRYEYAIDTVYTAEDGTYSFDKNNLLDSMYVKVEDIDGTGNGGEFATDSVLIGLSEEDRIKEGEEEGWIRAYYEKTVDLAMKPQESSEE